MIPGVVVAMGGRDWLVPPLTLGELRQLMPKVRQLTEIGASMGEAQIAVLVEIVTAALRRNYPDVTLEQVENLLDLEKAVEGRAPDRPGLPGVRGGGDQARPVGGRGRKGAR